MARFGRVLTAMVTPFTDDGALDLDGAATLARWLVDNGNDGVVVAGTTGEAPTLSKTEHLELVRAVREALPDSVVVAGAGSNDTRHAIEMTETVTGIGVDAVLSVGPYFIFLGGLGEIGRNCMAIEQGAADDPDRTVMLIDCGLMFPEANMHGIDLILPDFTYLRENANRIQALVLTHGHEDHVGAIQYLLRDHDGIGDLRDDPLPIYGSAWRSGSPATASRKRG
jgi:glyoxylase-like metal-dependent hydrolase (beta-lactamase superfamily II)